MAAHPRYPTKVLRLLPLALGALLVVPVVAAPTVSSAQPSWGLTRDPRQPPRPGARPGARPQGKRPPRPGARPQGKRPPRPASPGSSTDRSDVLIQRYRAVLEADPRESFAFHRLLDLYRERDGNIDALVTELEQRVADEPEAFAPRMLLGHIQKAQSRNEDALGHYRRAAELRPNDPAPHQAIGAIHRAADRPAEARASFERALEHTREDTAQQELLRALGEIALDQADYDAARGFFDRVARGSGSSVYLMMEYARALAARNLHERAIAEYDRVLQRLRGDNRVVPPVLLELGRAHLGAGSVDASIEVLDRALRLSGQQAGVRAEILDVMVEAYRQGDRLPELVERLGRDGARGFENNELLGRIHDEIGNEQEALTAYRAALRANPRHIDTRVRIVQLLSRSGRIDEVIEEYRQLMRTAPGEPRFVVELATLLMQVGRRDEALQMAEQTGRRYPRDPSVHQALAELYTRWDEEELATREVQILARIEPNDPAHLIALGSQQFEAGRQDAAVATWRRLLGVEHDRAAGHAALAAVLADHDLLELADHEYREAVRLDDDEIQYVRGLAGVLERRSRDQRAMSEFDRDAVAMWTRVLELADATDRAAKREARQRVVGIWTRRGLIQERIEEWRRAFAGVPPDVEAGRFLAEAYLRARPRRAEEAERTLARVIGLVPGDVESLIALERVRTTRGDLAGAIDTLTRLVDADPRRAPSYLSRMAEHALALYRDEEAVRYAEMAVERTPDDANAHRRLGDLYRARQDMERAVGSYQRAIELNDRLFSTYFDLAEIHLARAELEDADRLFRGVVRASPDDDLVTRAARASIQVHLGAGTLEDLERDLLPLALGHPQRPIYRKLVVELYDALTRPLIQATTRGGAEAREADARLRRLGTRALKPLLEALADQDPAQKRVAIAILGHLGNPNAAAPLLAAAEGEGDMDLRMRSLAAAGAVAGPALTGRFVALAEGPERRLRGVATWSLARIGDRAAIAKLRELLAEGDPSVRAFACMGLGRARDRASGDDLERLLREDRNLHARAAAAWALGELGDPARVPMLVSALRGSAGLLARASASALGAIGDPRAREALSQGLFDPADAQRRASASALARVGRAIDDDEGPVAFPVPDGQASAGLYLDHLLSGRVDAPSLAVDLAVHRDALSRAAGDALRGPVERAMAALDVLGSRPRGVGLGPLTATLDEWPEAERVAGDRELAALAVAVLPDLLHVGRHADPTVRELTVHVLARIDDPRAGQALVAALDDPEPAVQRAALAALGSLHAPAPGAAERVASTLERHPDWSARMRAAQTLGRMRATTAIPALASALSTDEYAFVRSAAAAALGRVDGPSAVPPLAAALGADAEPRVREAAARALSAMRDPSAAAALAAARAAGDPRVAAALAGLEAPHD